MKSVAAEEATKVIAEENTNSVACGVDCSMRRTKVSSHVGCKTRRGNTNEDLIYPLRYHNIIRQFYFNNRITLQNISNYLV